MREQENKRLLTYPQYVKLMQSYRQKAQTTDPYVQINYYFDTNDFALYKSGETLRVREKNAKLKLQYKSANQGTESLYDREEKSISISELPKEIMPSAYFPTLHCNSSCQYIGNVVTIRQDFQIPHMTISLDCNRYLGRVDYEAEWEWNTSNQFPIPDRLLLGSVSESKYRRFIKAYFSFMGIPENGNAEA